MMCSRGIAAKLALLAAGQAMQANAECAFRVEWFTLNISDPATVVAPVVNPGAGYRVINPNNPLLYLVDEEKWIAPQVNCNATTWRYQLESGEYTTNVTFPDGNGTQVAHEELFKADGPNLLIDSYPREKAVAISDSLFGRNIEVALTCDQDEFVPQEESCVVFKLNFTNSSPEPDMELLESALYRFDDPAVPGFILPAAGDWAPEEDVWLNVDNPIVDIDGSVTEAGCNGEFAEYLGEDGNWYFFFTGQEGVTYNLTHVFYATEFDRVNVAKLQKPWSPHVEMALFNRTVRLSIFCNNINAREEGYVLFKVGDGSETFDLTLKEYEAILSGETSSSTKRGVGGFSSWLLPGVLSLVAAAVLSVALTGVAP